MDIAPKFTAKNWKELDLDNNETHWQKAIEVLESRLRARYIEPTDQLIEFEKNIESAERRFGFSILAIDLLLIETIQAFKDGLETTEGKSKKTFTRFLLESPHFSPFFKTKQQREDFYKEFRCGILHQAEIQSSALVWSIGELYERVDGIEILNRNAVHQAIKDDFEDYISQLRKAESVKLRKNFRKKMDSVAARDNIT